MRSLVSDGVAGNAGEVALANVNTANPADGPSSRQWVVDILSVASGKVLQTATSSAPALLGSIGIADGNVVITETLPSEDGVDTYDIRAIPVAGLGNDYQLPWHRDLVSR